ncbi:MAG: M20 family metallopeptidase [Bacteroidota bacterium]|nr:M20 family metallopeptidase [Bacteroidota bacterium]
MLLEPNSIEIRKIKSLASDLLPWLKNIRHHFHSYPELSFQEYETTCHVENILNALNIPNHRLLDTGLIAIIKGNIGNSNKCIALRADLDALPITETNQVEYSSTRPGIMHACGHDVHTSCLLGVAKLLSQLDFPFEGYIKMIFQPGEEKLPGGASLLIEKGVLTNPTPSSITALHVTNELNVGELGFRSGMYMASTDEIYITFTGNGGHGAMPHLAVDVVLAQAELIVALQQVVSRLSNPAIPSVLSFGKVVANGSTNVIPSTVELQGTFRTFDETWRFEAHNHIRRIANGIAQQTNAVIEVNIIPGYPFLSNDADLTQVATNLAHRYVDKPDMVKSLGLRTTAEDFAWYAQQIPGLFYRLGTGNDENRSSVHTPSFDIDENALAVGASFMTTLALTQLQNLED